MEFEEDPFPPAWHNPVYPEDVVIVKVSAIGYSSDKWIFVKRHHWYKQKDFYRCSSCQNISTKNRYAVLNGNPKCKKC